MVKLKRRLAMRYTKSYFKRNRMNGLVLTLLHNQMKYYANDESLPIESVSPLAELLRI